MLSPVRVPANFRRAAPAVSDDELRHRLTRIRREMALAGIDLIVLTDKKNVDYFTDYQELSWDHKARPVFGLITQDDLVLVATRGDASTVETRPRTFSTLYYVGYLTEAVQAIGTWVKGERSGRLRHVALDYGQDMFGRGSLELVDLLSEIASDGRVKCAVDPIWKVRLIKSRFEAELTRTAFEIVNTAFDYTIQHARIGMTEYELYCLMQAQIFLNGAETADPMAMLFAKGDFTYSRSAKDRKLQNGHYLWTDFRATYGGYPADRNRIARAGEPQQWESDTYSAVRALTIGTAKQVRPGMTCADVYRIFEKMWGEAGIGPLYSGVTRIGHGGGLDVTEPPSLAKADSTVIEPGMILHIEPKLERDGAVFQGEEVFLVTEDGIEFLCALSPEAMPVIQ